MENTKPQSTPTLHPNLYSAFSYGWSTMKQNFIPLLLVTLVYTLLSGIGGSGSQNRPSETGLLSSLFWLFIAGPVHYGAVMVFLKAVRHESFEVKDIFSVFNNNYWNVFLANFLTTIIIIMGIILFIIPGIIIACKLAFVPYLVMDKNQSVSDAISNSWKMTSGYALSIFFMGFLSVFIVIGGILLLIVGIFPALLWVSLSFAALYHAIDTKSPQIIHV